MYLYKRRGLFGIYIPTFVGTPCEVGNRISMDGWIVDELDLRVSMSTRYEVLYRVKDGVAHFPSGSLPMVNLLYRLGFIDTVDGVKIKKR